MSNPKVSFCELIKPHCQETADSLTIPVVLAIGDTSYLDYQQILLKRDGYGPIGNGGNGLILHSTLAVDPDCGQPLGLLWEKLWNREHQAKPPSAETEAQKEKRLAEAHLWEYFESFAIQLLKEVELPQTKKRKARRATLGIRWGRVRLNAPARLKDKEYLEVYAVDATEINPPEGEEAVEWMLLTTEPVTSAEEALLVVRWYTYRWRLEEYHKILQSGCKAESYRLEGKSMAALLGFRSGK